MKGKREKPVAGDSVRVQQKEAEKVGADGDAIAIGGVGLGARVRVWRKINF